MQANRLVCFEVFASSIPSGIRIINEEQNNLGAAKCSKAIAEKAITLILRRFLFGVWCSLICVQVRTKRSCLWPSVGFVSTALTCTHQRMPFPESCAAKKQKGNQRSYSGSDDHPVRNGKDLISFRFDLWNRKSYFISVIKGQMNSKSRPRKSNPTGDTTNDIFIIDLANLTTCPMMG